MYNKQNPWIFIVGAIVILSLFFTIISGANQKNTLETYTGNNTMSSYVGDEPVVDEGYDTQIYTNKEIALSLTVPADYNLVVKSGYDTFVHAPTATSIQIQVNPYDPAVNNYNATYLSEVMANQGFSFVSFTRLSNTSYEAIYQKTANGAVYDYIEEVCWDREHIVVLKFTVDNSVYDKISTKLADTVASFTWIRENPVPEGYMLYYCEDGFEFGVPDTWMFSGAGNTFYAEDPNTGSRYMVQYVPNTSGTDLSDLTATDMAGIINTGKSNFMMGTFYAQQGKAQATASFINNNIRYNDDYSLYADDEYIYYVMFEYENGLLSQDVIDQINALFRIMRRKDEQPSITVSTNQTETVSENGIAGEDSSVSENESEPDRESITEDENEG